VKETEAAWFAGVLDSDGHIGIYRNACTTQRHKTPRYTASLVIVNTSELLMARLRSLWPASKLKLRRRVSEKHQPTYVWMCLTQASMIEVLLLLRPYLVAKPRQADLLLEFMATRKRTTSMGTGTRVPVEEVAYREACWKRMLALNSPLSTRND
jgi:hypothetical protein